MWKLSHYIIIEAVEPFKLHPTSMSYIYVWTPQTVVDGHMAAHSHHCHHRGFPRFGRVCWNPRWYYKCGNDPTTLLLRLYNLSNCIPHPWDTPYYTYTTWLSTLICCPLAYSSSLVTQFYPHYLDQILRFWVTCDDVSMSWLRLTGFPHPYQTYTKCVSTLISLICCPLAYSSSLLTQLLYPS